MDNEKERRNDSNKNQKQKTENMFHMTRKHFQQKVFSPATQNQNIFYQ